MRLRASESGSTSKAVLFAACAGNGLEFYNVTIYAFVAVTLSKLFFPHSSPTVAMLMTFSTFGVSYVVRPLGGLILGGYADRAGRRASLLLSISIMLVGTVMLAAAPTYRTAGFWAPALVVAARLLQGFALGGEFGSATAYLLERAPQSKRSLYVSLQFASQGIGGLLAVVVGFALGHLGPAQMERWGWRLPFLAGLLIAPAGLYLRRHMRDPREFLRTKPTRHPARLLLTHYGWRIAAASGSVAILSANIYLRVYIPTFMQMYLHLPPASTYSLLLISSITTAVLVPLAATQVTATNALRWMGMLIVIMLAGIWPMLHLIDSQRSRGSVIGVYFMLSILSALYSAPHAWFVSTMFPTEVRAAGVGAGYNFGVMLFGGFAPAIYSALVAVHGTLAHATLYVVFAGSVSLISVIMASRRNTVRAQTTSESLVRQHS